MFSRSPIFWDFHLIVDVDIVQFEVWTWSNRHKICKVLTLHRYPRWPSWHRCSGDPLLSCSRLEPSEPKVRKKTSWIFSRLRAAQCPSCLRWHQQPEWLRRICCLLSMGYIYFHIQNFQSELTTGIISVPVCRNKSVNKSANIWWDGPVETPSPLFEKYGDITRQSLCSLRQADPETESELPFRKISTPCSDLSHDICSSMVRTLPSVTLRVSAW